ncbi:MAG TPA: hypothetical protein VF467_09350, partial [Afipia sp.]
MTVAEQPVDLAPVSPPRKSREPRVWKFIGTSLWGVALFGAMFAGQVAVVAYFLVTSGETMDTSAMTALLTNGRIIPQPCRPSGWLTTRKRLELRLIPSGSGP